MSAAAPDDGEQAEGRYHFADPLPAAGSRSLTVLDDRQREHQMRDPNADDPAADLGNGVSERGPPEEAVDQDCGERHNGVHMRTRMRAEGQDQREERAAGRDRVGEQCQRRVPAAEPFRHDAGADHGDEQERGRHELEAGFPQQGSVRVRRRAADSVRLALHRQPVELVERQGNEQLDARIQLPARITKRGTNAAPPILRRRLDRARPNAR